MSKVDKIVNKISQLKKDLKKIQDACPHKKQDIKFLSLNEGVRWVCRDCNLPVGWPNDKEVKKWSSK